MSTAECYQWVVRLASFSICLQALENLAIARKPSFQSIWNSTILSREFHKPAFLFSQNLFFTSQVLLFCLSLFGLFGSLQLFPFYIFPAIFLAMLLIVFLTAARFRGTVNGGSDYMTVSLLLGLSLPYFFSNLEWGFKISIIYVAVNVMLSYTLSGLAKIGQKSWRDGTALQRFLTAQTTRLHQIPLSVLKLLGLSTILWEISFGALFIWPKLAFTYLTIAVIFHIVIFVTYGLNRFVWSWYAAFPAIYWFSQNIHI